MSDMDIINLKELKEQIDNLMLADSSGPFHLLQTMSVALIAAATELIDREQLMEVTDSVETIKDMEKGIDRDLLFEKTRSELKEMIGYIEV